MAVGRVGDFVSRAPYAPVMCRSIRTLRPPYAEQVTDVDVRAAALQYVRKISGYRTPAARNAEAFDRAVEAVAAATAQLLADIESRTSPPRARLSVPDGS